MRNSKTFEKNIKNSGEVHKTEHRNSLIESMGMQPVTQNVKILHNDPKMQDSLMRMRTKLENIKSSRENIEMHYQENADAFSYLYDVNTDDEDDDDVNPLLKSGGKKSEGLSIREKIQEQNAIREKADMLEHKTNQLEAELEAERMKMTDLEVEDKIDDQHFRVHADFCRLFAKI